MNKEVFICAFNNRRARIIYHMLSATARHLHTISQNPNCGHYEVEISNVRIIIDTWNDSIDVRVAGRRYEEVYYDKHVPISFIRKVLYPCAMGCAPIPLVSLDLLFDFE